MRKEKLEELARYQEDYQIIGNEEVNIMPKQSFLTTTRRRYLLANGKMLVREKLLKQGRNGDAVIIVPVTLDGEVVMTIEPRVHTKEGVGIGFPAGYIEKGETPIMAAKRELQEETGYQGQEFTLLGGCYQDEGCSSGENADIKVGNALPLMNIPVGTMIHNIELRPGKGGELARSAGASAQILGREGNYVMVRLSSGEQRLILGTCYATIGEVGNEDKGLVRLGKAGRTRHLGIRPTVRGSVMNPNDHPHGGGEGRAPIGRKGPVTPWGKPALGYKTRKKKASDKFIVRRRNSK